VSIHPRGSVYICYYSRLLAMHLLHLCPCLSCTCVHASLAASTHVLFIYILYILYMYFKPATAARMSPPSDLVCGNPSTHIYTSIHTHTHIYATSCSHCTPRQAAEAVKGWGGSLELIKSLCNGAGKTIVNAQRLSQRPPHFPQLIDALYAGAFEHSRQLAALRRI
jgi:hypothetical protein